MFGARAPKLRRVAAGGRAILNSSIGRVCLDLQRCRFKSCLGSKIKLGRHYTKFFIWLLGQISLAHEFEENVSEKSRRWYRVDISC